MDGLGEGTRLGKVVDHENEVALFPASIATASPVTRCSIDETTARAR